MSCSFLIFLVAHSCLRSLPNSDFPGLPASDTLTVGQAARGVAALLEQDYATAATDSAGTLAVSCEFRLKIAFMSRQLTIFLLQQSTQQLPP